MDSEDLKHLSEDTLQMILNTETAHHDWDLGPDLAQANALVSIAASLARIARILESGAVQVKRVKHPDCEWCPTYVRCPIHG